MVNNIKHAIADIHRVRLAEAAQSGAVPPTGAALEGGNFGVTPGAQPGDQGAAWAYALENLDDALQALQTANSAFLTALDNGNGVV